MMNEDKRALVIEKNSELYEKLKAAVKNSVSMPVIVDPIVNVLKVKKGVPTVIEYNGRRYILDHADNRK